MELKILEKLNYEQRQAVKYNKGPLFIIAGAGTGKTMTLTSKVAYLIATGVAPQRILTLTFTNKAAREMKERILDMVGPAANMSWISTFHSFGLRFLRRHISILENGLDEGFVVIDEDDAKKIIRDSIKELGIDEKTFPSTDIYNQVSALKVGYERFYLKSEDLERLLKKYQEYLIDNNLVDFDDLILYTLQILTKEKTIREHYQEAFEYILVDEFQDIDNVQYEMIELLCNESTSVFVVGDPDQTIYTWRGANINIIMDFEKHFEGTETIFLNQNYRSTKNILNGANSVIAYNRNRLEKDLFTENISGQKIVHFTAASAESEAEFVVRKIFELEKEGVEYHDIAILYRSSYLSRAIEKQLVNVKIPYILYGGVRFYDRAEIKDMLSYFRMLTTQDDLSFKRIVNTPKRGIGKKSVDDLFDVARSNGLTMLEAIDLFEGPARKKLHAFKEMIEDWNKRAEKMNVEEIFQMLFDESGYRISLELSKDPFDAERLENVKELMNDIVAFKNKNPEATLDDYLNNVSLYSDIQADKSGRFVSLMTIHGAKGLEFDNVFIIGMSEYVFPSAKTLDEGISGLEEERRLAYVAFTRAKKRLYLTDNRDFSYTTAMSKETSRFVKEIDEQYVQKSGYSSYTPVKETEKVFNPDVSFTITEKSNIKTRYKPADIVVHDYFGEGEVISVKNNLFAKIAFEYPHMVKTLVITTPKLRKKGE